MEPRLPIEDLSNCMSQRRRRIACIGKQGVLWTFDFDEVPLWPSRTCVKTGKVYFEFTAKFDF